MAVGIGLHNGQDARVGGNRILMTEKLWRSAGRLISATVGRLSIGAESFDRSLKTGHSPPSSQAALCGVALLRLRGACCGCDDLTGFERPEWLNPVQQEKHFTRIRGRATKIPHFGVPIKPKAIDFRLIFLYRGSAS